MGGEVPLPPEVCLELKIELDRLNRLQARCQEGLSRLADGGLSKEAYFELVEAQADAQKTWEARNREYFKDS
jgi:hypothetical protein